MPSNKTLDAVVIVGVIVCLLVGISLGVSGCGTVRDGIHNVKEKISGLAG